MRIIPVSSLEPGNVVGKPLLDSKGTTLLNAGVKLTEGYIKSLQSKGYTYLYVSDTESGIDVEPEESLDPVVRAKALSAMDELVKTIEKEFASLRSSSFEDVRSFCSSDRMRVLFTQGPVWKAMMSCISSILEEVLTRSTLAGLTSIKSEDSALYEHSIDVCVVAVMLGRHIGMTAQRLKQLASGCLLHDIGKVFLDKQSGDRESVRLHTLLGYELLKNNDDPDILAPHVAYEHHEHQDGSGKPRGLVGSNTIERDRNLSTPVPTLIGEIAAVANTYDNLLNGIGAPRPLAPDQALRTVSDYAGTRLNRELVTAFLRIAPVYPLGTEVVVDGGKYDRYVGIVTEVRQSSLDKPVIALYRDPAGKLILPVELDMKAVEDVLLRGKPLF
ncbi:MAG: HD domain-containing protein [Candidatus Hydrogenedentes bacterium]|nr:HD domain-containing protein [Candidatus Hydrogenedentota bacterium]